MEGRQSINLSINQANSCCVVSVPHRMARAGTLLDAWTARVKYLNRAYVHATQLTIQRMTYSRDRSSSSPLNASCARWTTYVMYSILLPPRMMCTVYSVVSVIKHNTLVGGKICLWVVDSMIFM